MFTGVAKSKIVVVVTPHTFKVGNGPVLGPFLL